MPIDVEITANGGTVSATARGSVTTRLTNFYTTLGLSEASVLRAIRRIADDNGYRSISFENMTKTMTPMPGTAQVVNLEREPIVMTTRTYRNRSSHPASYDGRLSHTDTNSVGTTWTSGSQIDAALEIGYSIGITGSARIAYSNSVGKSVEHSKQVVVSAEDGVKVDLQPGQEALATLTVHKLLTTLRIRYRVEYNGNVIGIHPDHSNMTFDLQEVLEVCGRPTRVVVTENICLKYFTDAEVVLRDL